MFYAFGVLAFPDVDPNRRLFLPVFALAEVVLVVAVPFLMIAGYHAFLNTEAGTIVSEVTAADPGYRSLVQHTQLHPLIERDTIGVVQRVSLISISETSSSAIEVPVELYEVGGVAPTLAGPQLVAELSEALRVDLEGATEVGIGGTTAVVSQLVGNSELTNVALPVVELDSGELVIDADVVEDFVVANVQRPAHESRLNVAVLSQVSNADLVGAVAELAASGFQIQETGNAAVFSTDPTVLTVPAALADSSEVTRLANLFGADILIDDLAVDQTTATLLLGADSDLVD